MDSTISKTAANSRKFSWSANPVFDPTLYIGYILAWCAYFALHSLLASLRCKRAIAAWRPAWVPLYRLTYNLLALLLLLPLMANGWQLHGAPLWVWSGIWGWLADAILLAAIVGFFFSLRGYDGMEFVGLRQWQRGEQRVEEEGALHISALHRYVRHPWYTLALVMIWSRDMDPVSLITALMITLYFFVGSRLEERKLLIYHGDAYRRYRERVGGLLPLPWRILSRKEAVELMEQADRHSQRSENSAEP